MTFFSSRDSKILSADQSKLGMRRLGLNTVGLTYLLTSALNTSTAPY